MASIVQLKVSPDDLQKKAREVTDSCSRMKKSFSNLNTAINGTRSYWIGEGGDANRKLYNDKVKEFDQMIKLLESYPTDLLKMANIYTNVENVNKSMATQLTNTVLH